MNDYVLLTDSTADLPLEITKKFGIEVLPMTFVMDGVTYKDGEMSSENFYEKIRNKSQVSTSQINPAEFEEYFEKYLKSGKDIFYVCFSSGLSETYNSACIATQSLQSRYPDRKIAVLDSLSASLGEGMLVYNLAKKKQEGASMDELEDLGNKMRLRICHWFTVDDLHHLQRGGRISQTAAFFGSMISIKPVLSFDDNGKMFVADKARGRQKAMEMMLSKMKKNAVNLSAQTVFISHADCESGARTLAQAVKSELGVSNIITGNTGAVIGSHVGSGTLALFFLGDNR